ncbi:MAG TPA: DNA primase [Thermoguttaceae bacterium]|nr:DNA primase [Thermoguttaceae bacterium]
MSFGSSLDTKEQVREAIDIVDLVGRYVQLRRRGRLYLGLCPWHDDTRPSFQVNPERQSFKCWVCDIGGDIFSFVMKMEGVSFPEALAMLADRAGIELKPRRPVGTGGSMEAGGEVGESESAPATATEVSGEGKRALYRAMAWTETQYHECLLNAPEAEPARRYLQDREITPESLGKFHLGFSPNEPDWILRRAGGTASRARVLETIGVLARSQDGSLYDRFRGRLLFPIRDTQDRPVGLGGRVLPDSGSTSRAKYVNSPETPLFTKSDHLYGLDVARSAFRKGRTALVMEGYTDCIIAQQHGFQNAVAVLGTALGERHVRLLKRFVDRIVLVLDGDEAGQRRANEVLALFLAENVDLRILTLPEGMDPADFLGEHGAEAFADLLANRARDALEHAFEAKTRGLDLEGDVHASSLALEEILSILATAPRLRHDTTGEHRLRQEKTLGRLAFLFRVPEHAVRQRLTALRRAAPRRRLSGPVDAPADEGEAESRSAVRIDPWERELLEIVVRHPECVPQAQAEIAGEQLAFEPARKVYEACCRLSDAGTIPTFDRLMLEFDDPVIKNLLVELDEKGHAKELTDPESLLQNLIRSFQRKEAERLRPVREGSLREGGLDESEELALLREIAEQERTRQGISDPTDG